MGFRKKYNLIRYKQGILGDDGNWANDNEEPFEIMASIQPLNMQETQFLPEGARTGQVVKLYTDTYLRTAKEATNDKVGNDADVILYFGDKYKVISCAPYQSGVINHYKAIAVMI